ncbi:MAG: hypothetical protein J2P31_15740 [Blastocatellia bacterium]|nr:hypothetical protein [Blastocatellia bacterium]
MEHSNDITLRAEIADMKTQISDTHTRLAKSEGALEQLNKAIAAGNRMTNWQFLGFVVVMAGTLFGTLYWATGVLERRLDQFERNVNTRFDDANKRFEERLDDTNKRFDDMNKRFEDLKQVVLSRR